MANEDFPNVVIRDVAKKTGNRSKIAGVPEQIVHRKSGLLFNAGDKYDLQKDRFSNIRKN